MHVIIAYTTEGNEQKFCVFHFVVGIVVNIL